MYRTRKKNENGQKTITNGTRLLLWIWNVGCFLTVWFGYYETYAMAQSEASVALPLLAAYLVLYHVLCKVYRGFSIASSPVGETVFAQLVSFGVADLVSYVECCLLSGGYVGLLPLAVALVLQFAGSALVIQQAKQYFIRHVPPQKTLVIYGDVDRREAEDFCRRILKLYSHLFAITTMLPEGAKEAELAPELAQCEIVLCYELTPSMYSRLSRRCVELHKAFYFTPRIETILSAGCAPRHLLDTPLMKYEYAYEKKMAYDVAKRAFDLLLSLLLLLLLSPLMLVIAAAIHMEDSGTVIFRQMRCTRDGREFEMFKFRSMVMDAEKEGAAMCETGDRRLTKIGSFLRRTRLDELPQLVNILRGEMSFVGPRPERREFMERYQKELPEFSYRLRVKGGLTGYAQIYGRYDTSAYDKLRLDLIYMEHRSLLLDAKLLLLTLRILFQPEKAEGVPKQEEDGFEKK